MLSELHPLTDTPTWPPTQHRKSIDKDEKHSKSARIDSCSYVKGELVETVGSVVFIMTYFHNLISHQFYDKQTYLTIMNIF